jgi:hypothetical protein
MITDNDDHITCIRAGIEMSKAEWMAIPSEVRARYWKETDWGKRGPASAELVEIIRKWLNRTRNSH